MLSAVLECGDVRLEPLAERHKEPLRIACAADGDIWQIYPISMTGDAFDASWAQPYLSARWIAFAIMRADELVGVTAFIDADPANGTAEIGGTYLRPDVRGSGLNDTVKRLMLDHLFDNGFRRAAFRIDERNTRSGAAVLKLGAVKEGVLRADRITWTGHIRDTGLYSILAGEWLAAKRMR